MKGGRGAKKRPEAGVRFDMGHAREIADAFSGSSGVPCTLYGQDGAALYSAGRKSSGCAACQRAASLAGAAPDCARLHSYGAFQAEKLGGRYIYPCPAGMAFTISPIIIGGSYAGALRAGPVRMAEAEDLLEEELFAGLPPEKAPEAEELLSRAVQVRPRVLEYLSAQLFADAVYISDGAHELFMAHLDSDKQSLLGDYISRVKKTGQAAAYPMEKETELFYAVSGGDRELAGTLLNELLSYIYFYTSGYDEMCARITELLVALSRAAITGGADPERILSISGRYLRELRDMTGGELLTRWLAATLARYIDIIFDMLDTKHSNAVRRAVSFIRENYASRLTLEETARRAGYSPTYFSRLFKEETGLTFRDYLNALRVEKSKALLLSGGFSISEVSSLVGCGDQSHFCKLFKNAAGVTPDKFRKRARRIDSERERSGG